MEKLYYIGTKDSVIAHLQTYSERQGITLVPYSPDLAIEDLDYLLLIEPLAIHTGNYAVSLIWKYWLMQHHPATKLVVAAFNAGSGHQNLLSLLQLPHSLTQFLEQALAVGHYQPVYIETVEKNGKKHDIFTDPWKLQLPHTGEPILDVMEQFVRGHDKAHSFIHQISKVEATIEHINNGYVSEEEWAETITALQEVNRQLQDRWERYRVFMPYLPFAQFIPQIDNLMLAVKNQIQDYSKNIQSDDIQNPAKLIRELLDQEILPVIYAPSKF